MTREFDDNLFEPMTNETQTAPRESPAASMDPQRAAGPTAGTVYLNGRFLPRDQAHISVDDRGFLFGDGAYEVTRVVDGRLFEAERHRVRLARTLDALQIDRSGIDLAELDRVAERLLRENDLLQGEATVYVQVTRGAAIPRTHHYPPAGTPPTVYLSVARFTPPVQLRTRGARVITVADFRWSRCDLKTVNLLPNAMAKQQAVARGADEALFVRDGVLMEGAHTNMFWVLDGEVRTAPATNYILGGVTRDVVLGLAREAGMAVRETSTYATDIPRLQEAFITSTTSDVLPIVAIDGQPVGSGAPGPVAQRLNELLLARMRESA